MTPAELTQQWMAAADKLGLLFAHGSDEKVDRALEQLRKNLNVEFCALFPRAQPEILAAGVDSIIGSIQDRRREIEGFSKNDRGRP
jgi:hypothetical protein